MAFKKTGDIVKIEVLDQKNFKNVKCKKCKKIIAQKNDRIVKQGNIISMGITIVKCQYCGTENII